MGKSSVQLLLFLLFVCVLIPSANSTIANCYIYTSSNASCSLCNAGYYITGSGATCTAYDCTGMSQCSLCDSVSTCLGCNFGYQLSNSRASCTQITCADSNCNLCATTSTNQCYSCGVSYYVTPTHTCTLCNSTITHCEVCTYVSSLTCNTCQSGYYTDSSTTCATCASGQTNCLNCDSTATPGVGNLWCWDCISTYYISNYVSGTCSLCNVGVAHCLTCEESATNVNNITCSHCESPYYANVAGTTCVACSDITNCVTCT